MSTDNLFAGIPGRACQERFETLLEAGGVRIERIISTGQATPPGEWFDQDTDEWVVLLRGSAGLRLEGEARARVMRPGDHVHMPAHARHRVEWTDGRGPSVWLAVHWRPREERTPR